MRSSGTGYLNYVHHKDRAHYGQLISVLSQNAVQNEYSLQYKTLWLTFIDLRPRHTEKTSRCFCRAHHIAIIFLTFYCLPTPRCENALGVSRLNADQKQLKTVFSIAD